MSFLSSIDRFPANCAPGADRGLTWKVEPLNLAAARKIAPIWQDLAVNSAEKNIFSFPWFVIPSIDLMADKDPQILTIFENDLLIGLFLFRGDRGYSALPISFYRTALHPDQFLGLPLVRDGFEDKFAIGLAAWLDGLPRGKQFILMDLMSADGPVAKALANLCVKQKRNITAVENFERAAIFPPDHISDTADNLISSSRRKSLRRKARSLAKLGEVKVEKLASKDELPHWLDGFLALENSGWKKDAGSSVLSNPKEIAFYEQMIPDAFDAHSLNFSRLTLDGNAIAYTMDLVVGGRAYCMKCAFDDEYRRYSPGVLMEYETLKFYMESGHFHMVDSCTDPENSMLNDMWPDKVAMTSLAIGRRGVFYSMLFRIVHFAKDKAKRFFKRGSAVPRPAQTSSRHDSAEAKQ